MARYAETTSVPPERSRAEIERILIRYGAEGFLFGYDQGRSMVAFRMRGRQIRMFVPQPDPNSTEITKTPTGRYRSPSARQDAYDQATRQRWRALVLYVKATLEAVESGVTTLEAAFLPHIVLPSGATVGEWVEPQIEHVYETGDMPALLPGVSGELEAGGG